MESSEEQEFVVIVQLEEPSEPLYEHNATTDEKDENITVIFEEEDYKQDNDTNITGATSVQDQTSEEQDIKISNVVDNQIYTNVQNNNDSTNNEANRKRIQEDKGTEPTQDGSSNGVPLDTNKKRKVELYAELTGPEWYNVKGNLVTPPIIGKNLPILYESLPTSGRPRGNDDLETFSNDKLREFIGQAIDDDAFDELSKYCSPERLKTGQELDIKSSKLSQGLLTAADVPDIDIANTNLSILKKYRLRQEKDVRNSYIIKLKYRGVRLIPWSQEDDRDLPSAQPDDVMLEPGKDVLYRVRFYRPYTYQVPKDRCTRGRHSVFSCEVWCAGRGSLAELRARVVCHNDLDIRLDVADAPYRAHQATAKELFPSGFLFINNTFYVDNRPGCKDHSRIIREWAVSRGMGEFPVKDMGSVTLDDVVVRLGYPEVYVHQGDCEHVFTFSEIRLLSPSDPLRLSSYPRYSSVSQHQTVYCTTCAEFSAKWVVVGCDRVPFDPAFFCDTCYKQYLYIDGVKIGEFRAYAYRGNETNTLKPC